MSNISLSVRYEKQEKGNCMSHIEILKKKSEFLFCLCYNIFFAYVFHGSAVEDDSVVLSITHLKFLSNR